MLLIWSDMRTKQNKTKKKMRKGEKKKEKEREKGNIYSVGKRRP